MARTAFTLVMLAVAGGMALLLGVVGIYGVISYGVSERRREIGIRLALGARPGELTGMFVRDGLVLAGVGAGGGLVAALALSRLNDFQMAHNSARHTQEQTGRRLKAHVDCWEHSTFNIQRRTFNDSALSQVQC